MTREELKKKVAQAPKEPGIYIFKDIKDTPLYIGKALDLKSRLKNYIITEDIRLNKMLSLASKIDFQIAENEIEALIMESINIKKFHPQFNIVMRDDKQYFYIQFTNEYFPRLILTHQPQKDGDYIGPFTDGASLKLALKYLRRIFPFCTCKQKHHNFCLNYHIEKCPGFCCLKNYNPSTEELKSYKNNIEAIKKVLSGQKGNIISDLKRRMANDAKKQNYEEAILLQDKIEKMERIFQNTQIIRKLKSQGTWGDELKTNKKLDSLKKELDLKKEPYRIEGYDISNIQGENATGAMVIFENGMANKNEYRKFKIRYKSSGKLGDTGMLREILERRFNHPEWPTPDLILIDGGKGQLSSAKSIIPSGIPIIALIKDDRHIGHKLLINSKDKVVDLKKLSTPVKNMILEIDEEAHRFAISYYRKLHRRKITELK